MHSRSRIQPKTNNQPNMSTSWLNQLPLGIICPNMLGHTSTALTTALMFLIGRSQTDVIVETM